MCLTISGNYDYRIVSFLLCFASSSLSAKYSHRSWWRRSSARVWSIKYGEVAIVIRSAWSMMLRTWSIVFTISLIHISGARKSRSISTIRGERWEVRGRRLIISFNLYWVLTCVMLVINSDSIHGVIKFPILHSKCAKSHWYWGSWICEKIELIGVWSEITVLINMNQLYWSWVGWRDELEPVGEDMVVIVSDDDIWSWCLEDIGMSKSGTGV